MVGTIRNSLSMLEGIIPSYCIILGRNYPGFPARKVSHLEKPSLFSSFVSCAPFEGHSVSEIHVRHGRRIISPGVRTPLKEAPGPPHLALTRRVCTSQVMF